MVSVIFIIPAIVTVIGYIMNKYPPKKVNWFIGYRTRKSMKDGAVWKIANQYCGKLWIKIGLIMLVGAFLISAIVYFKILIFSETFLAIFVLCEIAPLLLSGVMVENKIKDKDNSNM